MHMVLKKHRIKSQYSREQLLRMLNRLKRKLMSSRKVVFQWLAILGGTAAFLLLCIVLFSPLVTLREVRVERTDGRVDIERVQKALRPLFGRHLWFLPAHEIRTLLHEVQPDILDIKLFKRYPSGVTIKLVLDPLVARLNVLEPGAVQKAGTGAIVLDSFLTEKGMFVEYPQSSVGKHHALPLLTLVDWGVHPVVGQQLLDPSFIQLLQDAERLLLEQFGERVNARTVFLRAREFHLATSATMLWFDQKRPLQSQLDRYRIFLQHLGGRAAEEYVDLRITDRVVYQ